VVGDKESGPRPERFPKKPRCIIKKDKDGYQYTVEAEANGVFPAIEVWWMRKPRQRFEGVTNVEEHLIIRQDNGDNADVILLTPGQTYDLIDALTRAVVRP